MIHPFPHPKPRREPVQATSAAADNYGTRVMRREVARNSSDPAASSGQVRSVSQPSAHICIPRYGPKHDRCWCGDVVISLRDARQAAEPVRPCDSEPPSGDAA